MHIDKQHTKHRIQMHNARSIISDDGCFFLVVDTRSTQNVSGEAILLFTTNEGLDRGLGHTGCLQYKR